MKARPLEVLRALILTTTVAAWLSYKEAQCEKQETFLGAIEKCAPNNDLNKKIFRSPFSVIHTP